MIYQEMPKPLVDFYNQLMANHDNSADAVMELFDYAMRYRFLRNCPSVIQWSTNGGLNHPPEGLLHCYGGSDTSEQRRQWLDEAIDKTIEAGK